MKIVNYEFPKSSFLAMEKDLQLITDMMFKNKRFKKLLFHNMRTALNERDLTQEETYALFNKNIHIVPKLKIDKEVLNYVFITFDKFTPNATNPEFRDNVISFDIICHYDQWQLEDFQLRPFRIAAEIDTMFNEKHLTGIGKLQFLGAEQISVNDEFAGLSMMYAAIQGEEDKKGMPNPVDQEQFIKDFNELFNQ